MTLRLYFNHNVPGPILRGVRQRDVDCLTALEDQADRLPDVELLRRATAFNRVLFTMDDDLFAVAPEALAANVPFPGVIYAHPIRITMGQAVRDLELMAKVFEPIDVANQVLRLPLK